MTDTVKHTWFGPAAPIFGTWHLPAGATARAAVVLLPPVGVEAIVARRALRRLAERLADRGLAALRVDYPGTGDSASLAPDADHAEAWLAGAADAVAHARDSGALRVAIVGMRLGAAIAAVAADACRPVDAVVLWDPVESGARFLREEEMLFRVGVRDARAVASDDEAARGPGTSYSARTVASLRPLSVTAVLADEADGGRRVREGLGPVLLVTRTETAGGRVLAEVAEAVGVDAVATPGHVELFDWARLTVPEAAIDRIVGWLDGVLPGGGTVVDPPLRREAVVAAAPDGTPVVERLVTVGPRGGFGIVTQAGPAVGQVLVLTNAAPPAFHVGPAAMWVAIAREHAWSAGPSLRFDGERAGESPGGGDVTYPTVYTSRAVDDVVEAIRAGRALGDGRIALGGLCAAGWACLKAAEVEPVDSVVAVNPTFWRSRPLTEREAAWPRPTAGSKDGETSGGGVLRAARDLLRSAARTLTPEALWWRLAQRGIVRGPSGLVTPAVRRGTRVQLLLGASEAARFERARGARLVRAHRSSGLFTVLRADDVDHSLMTREARLTVASALVAMQSGPSDVGIDPHETITGLMTRTADGGRS